MAGHRRTIRLLYRDRAIGRSGQRAPVFGARHLPNRRFFRRLGCRRLRLDQLLNRGDNLVHRVENALLLRRGAGDAVIEAGGRGQPVLEGAVLVLPEAANVEQGRAAFVRNRLCPSVSTADQFEPCVGQRVGGLGISHGSKLDLAELLRGGDQVARTVVSGLELRTELGIVGNAPLDFVERDGLLPLTQHVGVDGDALASDGVVVDQVRINPPGVRTVFINQHTSRLGQDSTRGRVGFLL